MNVNTFHWLVSTIFLAMKVFLFILAWKKKVKHHRGTVTEVPFFYIENGHKELIYYCMPLKHFSLIIIQFTIWNVFFLVEYSCKIKIWRIILKHSCIHNPCRFLSTHMLTSRLILFYFQGNTIAPKENVYIRIPLVFTWVLSPLQQFLDCSYYCTPGYIVTWPKFKWTICHQQLPQFDSLMYFWRFAIINCFFKIYMLQRGDLWINLKMMFHTIKNAYSFNYIIQWHKISCWHLYDACKYYLHFCLNMSIWPAYI